MLRLLRALAVGSVLVLILAGCGGDDETAAPEDEATEEEATEEEATEEATEEEATEEATEEPAQATGPATIAVSSTDLGDVLVDGDGMTVYMFDPDEQGESTCYDECATNWPPVLTEGDAEAGDGADSALLGTTEREDGSMQVTYDDWPVYLWANDSAPGDTTGQAVNEVWWVVAPDGTPMRDGS